MAFFNRFKNLFNSGGNDGSKKSEKNNSNKKSTMLPVQTPKTTSTKKNQNADKSEEESTAPVSASNSVSPHLIPSTILGKLRTKKSVNKHTNPRRVSSVGGGAKKKKSTAIKEKPKKLKSLRKVKSGSIREGDDMFPPEAKSRRENGKNSTKKSSNRPAESPRQRKKKKKSRRSRHNTTVTTQQATTTAVVEENIVFGDEQPAKSVTPTPKKPRRKTSDTTSSHINSSVMQNVNVDGSQVECLPLKSKFTSQRMSQRNSDIEQQKNDVKEDDPAIKELEPVVMEEKPEEAMNRDMLNKMISELTPEMRALDEIVHDPWLDLKVLQERDQTIYSRQQTRLNTAATYSFFADNELCSVKHESSRAEKVSITGPITRRTFSVMNRDRQIDDVIDLEDIRMMPTQVASGEQISPAFQSQQQTKQKDSNSTISSSTTLSAHSNTALTPVRTTTPKNLRDK